MSLATWMKDSNIQDKFFYNLKIPGTHNSGSYNIDTKNPLQSEFNNFIPANYLFPCIFKGWTKCQSVNIFEQLESGVRYLDIRISLYNEEIYVSHSFCGLPLTNILDDVVRFYEKYGNSEICVCNIKKL